MPTCSSSCSQASRHRSAFLDRNSRGKRFELVWLLSRAFCQNRRKTLSYQIRSSGEGRCPVVPLVFKTSLGAVRFPEGSTPSLLRQYVSNYVSHKDHFVGSIFARNKSFKFRICLDCFDSSRLEPCRVRKCFLRSLVINLS